MRRNVNRHVVGLESVVLHHTYGVDLAAARGFDLDLLACGVVERCAKVVASGYLISDSHIPAQKLIEVLGCIIFALTIIALWRYQVCRHHWKFCRAVVLDVLARLGRVIIVCSVLCGQGVRQLIVIILAEATIRTVLPMSAPLVLVTCLFARFCRLGVPICIQVPRSPWQFPNQDVGGILEDMDSTKRGVPATGLHWDAIVRLGPATKTLRLLLVRPGGHGLIFCLCGPVPSRLSARNTPHGIVMNLFIIVGCNYNMPDTAPGQDQHKC
mmetsp:Transcript_2471/g.5361  ORF Transcript_2471/g.5361 Transcript_2471/m.5361 type:complete len:269 (+) Transcript_2471:2633-3439(+)